MLLFTFFSFFAFFSLFVLLSCFSIFVKSKSTVLIGVYDLRGRLVKALFDGKKGAGLHNVVWSGVDQNGKTLPSGVYFYSMSTGQKTFTKKMVLSK